MKILASHFTPLTLPDGFVGEAYPEVLITVVGGEAPYSFSSVPPDGLVFNHANPMAGTIVLSGTPTTVGDFPFQFRATDVQGRVFIIEY